MSEIKIGACDWGLPGAGLYATQIAASVGLDALSLKIGLYENDYPITHSEMQKIYLSEQQKYGIEYCAIALNDFDNIPMHARQNTPEYDIVWDLLKRAVETAKALGVAIIQVPGFAKSEVKTEEDYIQSARAFQYLCDKAGEYGISVASENTMSPNEFRKMVDLVHRDNFSLYFDSQNYHLFGGYCETDILSALYPHMCNQIHVKDGHDAMSGSLLGSGDSGFYDTMEWLQRHDFSGYILLENYYDQLPLRSRSGNPFDLLREDIRILRQATEQTTHPLGKERLNMKIAVIGAGRIGRVHIENICTSVREMEIKTVADPFFTAEAEAFVKGWGIPVATKNVEDVFSDPEIEAVLICSSTDTHTDFILKAAEAGKHIFCEKPIDHDVKRVRMALDAVQAAGVKLQIGFVRRFDHNHHAVYEAVRAGKIGTPHMLRISSRDPEPPSIEYVRRSGGIFFDMMIHDFDMIRFLAGSEVTEVYAKGAVLVDPAIGKEGDVDTALVTLTFENGAIGMIDNSRQAVYGYDQRLEVFGSEGAVQDENDIPSTVILSRADGTSYETAYKVMWDRYTRAFVDEMHAFADAVIHDKVPPVTGLDGLYPVLMAAAANKSIQEGRPVKISEVDV